MADALCWLLAARQFIFDVIELETKGAENPALADGLAGTVAFFADFCHVQADGIPDGEVGRICAETVHGYNRHPAWDEAGCHTCYSAEELAISKASLPASEHLATAYSDVSEPGQAHPAKAGPCVKCEGLEGFVALRAKLDTCLTGWRLAKIVGQMADTSSEGSALREAKIVSIRRPQD